MPLCLPALLCALLTAQQTETLWKIGQPGDGFRELAIAGDYRAYVARFPQDAAYVVGRSSASQDWPYVHPGPDDAWAGRRQHTFKIRFSLDSLPTHACRLILDLANTHYGVAPRLEIQVNGGRRIAFPLAEGTDDRSLTDPSLGKRSSVSLVIPPRAWNVGNNEIAITNAAGSWLIYDAVRLETGASIPSAPEVTNLRADSTVLFRRVDGRLRQAVHVSLDNLGTDGVSELKVAGVTKRVDLAPGRNDFYVWVEPFARKASLPVVVRSEGKEWSTRLEALPSRKWTVFVGPSAHTDIGYTDLQERTFVRHNQNTLRALEACSEDPPFKWNLEVAFQADLFSRTHPEEFAALVKRAREGRIGVQGLYLNMLTGLCSGEELAEAVSRAQTLSRAHGFRVESANLSDVPTSIGTLPMILRKSGVRYFAEAVNTQRGPLFAGAPSSFKQSPFWWEAFDGSRVLALFSEQYAQASSLGLTQSTSEFAKRIPGWLRQFERPDYPADAVYVYGAFSDNQPLDPRYTTVAQQWNREWEYPKVVVGRVDEFFRYVERTAGKRLPVLRGDFGSYWEDGAGSSARETALVRRARTKLESAERWHALASLRGKPFPEKALRAAWDNVLFYDEHTWGAWCATSEPNSEQTRKQWEYKAAYAERASQQAELLYRSSLTALAGPPKPASGRYVVVPNAESWTRDIPVRVRSDESLRRIIDASSGKPIPVQVSGNESLFIARSVPPLAFKSYRLERGESVSVPDVLAPTNDAYTWKTTHFTLRFDPATGALCSLKDLGSGREWVDVQSGFGLNQFLYVPGGKGTSLILQYWKAPQIKTITPVSARVELVENGPVRGVLRVRTEMPEGPSIESYVIAKPDGDIQFTNVVHKPETFELEAGYFAFPIQLDRPVAARAFVELPYGVEEAEREQLPGACRDWYSMNGFTAVSDGRQTAVLSSPDAPVITIGAPFQGKWMKRLEGKRNALFSYAFNNYWDTNYRAGQGGDLLFSYTLRLRSGGFDPAAATRFGRDVLAAAEDLVSAGSPLKNGTVEAWLTDSPDSPDRPLLQTSGSAIVGRVTRRNGKLLARLYNPSSRPVLTRFGVPGFRSLGAVCADLAGFPRDRAELTKAGDGFVVTTPARGLETILVDVETPRKEPAMDLWALAKTKKDVHRISTLFTAQDVRKYLSTEAGIDAAIDWCRQTGVTKAYVESFRGGYEAPKSVLAHARDRLRLAGIEVSGCVTTVNVGKPSTGWKDLISCYTDRKTQDRLAEIFSFTAGLFDEIMIDDFWFTDCACPECDIARKTKTVRIGDAVYPVNGNTWEDYRCELMVRLSRDRVLKPARAANPKVRLIIKYPQWYDRFHERGYEVVRESADFDRIWVGTETRDYRDKQWGGTPQYEGYFIVRWLGGIGGEKCGGGWFDPYGTTEQTYVEQARQTILGGARESLLFCYGSLQEGTGPRNVEAFRAALPQLLDVAAQVRKRTIVGVAAYKPPNSHPEKEPRVFDFVGMLGVPLVPCHTFPKSAPAAFFSVHAASDPQIVQNLTTYIASGRPTLVTDGLAQLLAGKVGLNRPNVRILPVKSDPKVLLEVNGADANTIRKFLLAPMHIAFQAPARVSLYLFTDGSRVVENFNDESVQAELNGKRITIPARQWTCHWCR